MSLLVRSWNVYQGMTSPHTRRNYLEQAVRLIASDHPDVVCLQEVPLWGRRRLEGWSDMRLIWNSTRRVWFPPGLGGWITRLDQGFFRSAVSGQANAILLDRRLEPLERRRVVINRGRRERQPPRHWESRVVAGKQQSFDVEPGPHQDPVGDEELGGSQGRQSGLVVLPADSDKRLIQDKESGDRRPTDQLLPQ